MPDNSVTLATICDGQLGGIFDEMVALVVDDIVDIGKKAIAPREIILTIRMIPNDTRRFIIEEASGKVKLAPSIPVTASAEIFDGSIFENRKQIQHTLEEASCGNITHLKKLREEEG